MGADGWNWEINLSIREQTSMIVLGLAANHAVTCGSNPTNFNFVQPGSVDQLCSTNGSTIGLVSLEVISNQYPFRLGCLVVESSSSGDSVHQSD